MATQPKSLITEELKAQLGKVTETRVSFPVSASDIRKWAIAVYWPEKPPRLFWDEEYAKKTRYGGIVAPEEFNPFAWPAEGSPFIQVVPGSDPNAPGTRGLNAGADATYSPVRIRPGDVITAVTTVLDVYERQGRLGRMLFIVMESPWTNQRGELVKVFHNLSMRY